MKLEIYIPSRKRPDRQITAEALLKAGIEFTKNSVSNTRVSIRWKKALNV